MKSRKQSDKYFKFNGNPVDKGMHSSQLMELFEEQLKDILWAEKALIKAIPKMISQAASDDLILILTGHLKETNEQVTRLAKVFKEIGKKPSTIKCDAMEGLITETSVLLEDCEKGPKCDAGIISAAQKIEHYEIATYGTLREFAETLGLKEAEKLLLETLDEEKTADQKLTDIAVDVVNMGAAVKQA
ncbi:MAG: ferritin-like domain-containing protein [Balneolaceae bacterium]|nr:ferritin-like domain-containing protein [Balneolaceae bacterium]